MFSALKILILCFPIWLSTHSYMCLVVHLQKKKSALAQADLHKQAEKLHKQFICYWPECSLAHSNTIYMLLLMTLKLKS